MAEKFESDFVNETPVEFEVDGKKFKYKPTTAGEENNWLDEYMEVIDVEGKKTLKQNFEKLNQCKVRNLVGVPYSKAIIKKIINIDKEWSGLTKEQKWTFLGKLKPTVFSAIIKRIDKIDEGDTDSVNF